MLRGPGGRLQGDDGHLAALPGPLRRSAAADGMASVGSARCNLGGDRARLLPLLACALETEHVGLLAPPPTPEAKPHGVHL